MVAGSTENRGNRSFGRVMNDTESDSTTSEDDLVHDDEIEEIKRLANKASAHAALYRSLFVFSAHVVSTFVTVFTYLILDTAHLREFQTTVSI